LYLKIPDITLVPPAASTAALVWAVRKFALQVDGKALPGWVRKIPVDAIAGVLGVVLAFLVLIIWGFVVQWVLWGHTSPDKFWQLDPLRQEVVALMLLILAIALLWGTAQFPAFINLSTLQFLYGQRLARAYLGATNGLRYAAGTDTATRHQWRSVAASAK